MSTIVPNVEIVQPIEERIIFMSTNDFLHVSLISRSVTGFMSEVRLGF
jgi:hypothetical protein